MTDQERDRIQQLSATKRALLMKALLSASVQPATSIPRRPADGAAPLSFAQQRMWFLHQLDPHSTAMNLHYAVRLRGRLDVAALERSLRTVVHRHETLRSTFTVIDGEPVQVIADDATLRLPVEQVAGGGMADREAEVLRRATHDASQPFDLERGPVLRTTLLRLADDDHVLLLSMPHAVADGWSLGVLVGDVKTLYQGESLPQLPIQYADYAAWQRSLPDGEFADGLAYWRDRLVSASSTLDLPTDRPRPPRQTERGAVLPVTLSRALADRLHELSRREGATLFMTLLAAVNVLLSRYSGQADISFGTPVANRTRAEVEGLIGFFVNTLVLRTDLSGDPTFRELIGRVRDTALGAYQHQETPFERLVEELRPVRDLSRTPLFQVMFILQNAPLPPLDLPGLRAERLIVRNGRTKPGIVHNGTAKFDLTLDMTETPAGLTGTIEYSTDLFDAGRIERMIGHLGILLDSAAALPDQPISRLPLLSTIERRQILHDWNDTGTDAAPARLVHEIVQQQAARAPDRVAARCEGEQLTYGELNRRANRLARVLAEDGVGPEVLVALLADRGIDYLVVLLAILKAGGAFLPLDPQQPAGRLGQMISHSRCALIITADHLGERAAEAVPGTGTGGPALCRLGDLLGRAAAGEGDGDLPPSSEPGNLAYVLYTSGSTGTPKGVMVEHAGLVNHLYAKIHDLGITSADVLAQNGPQSFDVSVWQFLAALTCGGRVEIFPDAIARDPARLLAEVEQCGVTVLQVVPSILRELVEEAAQAELGGRPRLVSLRWMVPTGDALLTELCRRWFKLFPDVPMLNTYGSTECSDDQCHLPIHEPPGPQKVAPVVSIGRPIANMRAYVLDRNLRPMPVGVPGELYIAGIGVGRGYLGDPVRTAQMFLPDPFAPAPGGRLYRTRDDVMLGPDGALEFLGRNDQLVKVRGFRVEPGEIEAALLAHPDVKDTVVVARDDPAGHKRLIAYVVHGGSPGGGFATQLLRDFLRARLPEYMVPAGFVGLAALPLNANGKVDRKALPEPELTATPQRYAAPRTPLENDVAKVWAEVLELDRISVEDSFFDLGGHSLLATQVVSRLRRSFDVDLPLRVLFEADTVAALAAEIERRLAADGGFAELLSQVENLSDEEVERLLREHGTSA